MVNTTTLFRALSPVANSMQAFVAAAKGQDTAKRESESENTMQDIKVRLHANSAGISLKERIDRAFKPLERLAGATRESLAHSTPSDGSATQELRSLAITLRNKFKELSQSATREPELHKLDQDYPYEPDRNVAQESLDQRSGASDTDFDPDGHKFDVHYWGGKL